MYKSIPHTCIILTEENLDAGMIPQIFHSSNIFMVANAREYDTFHIEL